jgi:hypothetical protein
MAAVLPGAISRLLSPLPADVIFQVRDIWWTGTRFVLTGKLAIQLHSIEPANIEETHK